MRKEKISEVQNRGRGQIAILIVVMIVFLEDVSGATGNQLYLKTKFRDFGI